MLPFQWQHQNHGETQITGFALVGYHNPLDSQTGFNLLQVCRVWGFTVQEWVCTDPSLHEKNCQKMQNLEERNILHWRA